MSDRDDVSPKRVDCKISWRGERSTTLGPEGGGLTTSMGDSKDTVPKRGALSDPTSTEKGNETFLCGNLSHSF